MDFDHAVNSRRTSPIDLAVGTSRIVQFAKALTISLSVSDRVEVIHPVPTFHPGDSQLVLTTLTLRLSSVSIFALSATETDHKHHLQENLKSSKP